MAFCSMQELELAFATAGFDVAAQARNITFAASLLLYWDGFLLIGAPTVEQCQHTQAVTSPCARKWVCGSHPQTGHSLINIGRYQTQRSHNVYLLASGQTNKAAPDGKRSLQQPAYYCSQGQAQVQFLTGPLVHATKVFPGQSIPKCTVSDYSLNQVRASEAPPPQAEAELMRCY